MTFSWYPLFSTLEIEGKVALVDARTGRAIDLATIGRDRDDEAAIERIDERIILYWFFRVLLLFPCWYGAGMIRCGVYTCYYKNRCRCSIDIDTLLAPRNLDGMARQVEGWITLSAQLRTSDLGRMTRNVTRFIRFRCVSSFLGGGKLANQNLVAAGF